MSLKLVTPESEARLRGLSVSTSSMWARLCKFSSDPKKLPVRLHSTSAACRGLLCGRTLKQGAASQAVQGHLPTCRRPADETPSPPQGGCLDGHAGLQVCQQLSSGGAVLDAALLDPCSRWRNTSQPLPIWLCARGALMSGLRQACCMHWCAPMAARQTPTALTLASKNEVQYIEIFASEDVSMSALGPRVAVHDGSCGYAEHQHVNAFGQPAGNASVCRGIAGSSG